MLTRAEAEKENVDTEEEKLRAEVLITRRNEVVSKNSRFTSAMEEGSSLLPVYTKKVRTPARPNLTPQEKKERKALWDRQYRERQKEKALLQKSREQQKTLEEAEGEHKSEPDREVKPTRQSARKRSAPKRDTAAIPQHSPSHAFLDNSESKHAFNLVHDTFHLTCRHHQSLLLPH